MEVKIKVARDFSSAVGGRYIKDGAMSGESFRVNILEPIFKMFPREKDIVIDFDGGYGYPSSWIEEAFGGLVRAMGYDMRDDITFISNQEPDLPEEIEEYMSDAVKTLEP